MTKLFQAATLAAVVMTTGTALVMSDVGHAETMPTATLASAMTTPIAPATDVAAPSSTVVTRRSGPIGPLPAPEPESTAAALPTIERKATETLPTTPAAPGFRKGQGLAAMVADHVLPAQIDAELKCLATAVYFESKSEPLTGQLAVAHVVRARAASGKFPRTLCGVVKQPGQFSFVRGGQLPSVPTNSRDWREAVAIARIAQADAHASPVPGALFFHATHVSPGWKRARVGQVQNHIFYR